MISWEEKGCKVCRTKWETGVQPTQLAANLERHAHLHHCDLCGAYWENNERYADLIAEAQVRIFYPEVLC